MRRQEAMKLTDTQELQAILTHVKESGYGHLCLGDDHVAEMLNSDSLIQKEKISDYEIFNLSAEFSGQEGWEMRKLRLYNGHDGLEHLQFSLDLRQLGHKTNFSWEPDSNILYGNFLDSGHDFRVDVKENVVRIRSLPGGVYKYEIPLVPARDKNIAMIPRNVRSQYSPTRLVDVEVDDKNIILLVDSDNCEEIIEMVLPREVYSLR